jgi:hypothetical protein
VASAFVPGGPVAKTVGAAVSTYMLMDPKQKGLAELFKDTAVEKVFLLDEAFKYSEKKPNDTEMQGRLKNVLDYTFGEALIGAAVKGIYAMYNGAKQVKNVYYAKGSIEDAERVAANLDKPPATPPSPSVEPRPVVEQVPTKEAQAAAKVRQEAEQLDFESWVKALNPKEEISQEPITIDNIIKNNPEAFSKRGAQTTPEMLAKAQERRKDPMYISNLIRQRAADPTSVFSAEDYLAIELEASDAAIRANTASQKALTTGSELDLLAANEALEHTLKLSYLIRKWMVKISPN